MGRNYMPSLGTCCACGGKRGVRTVMCLDKKSPTPGKGWGCMICQLPADGAVVVICDKCIKNNVPPKWACRGWPAEPDRVDIELLSGVHEHDRSKHK